jgi:hypothetical protein
MRAITSICLRIYYTQHRYRRVERTADADSVCAVAFEAGFYF